MLERAVAINGPSIHGNGKRVLLQIKLANAHKPIVAAFVLKTMAFYHRLTQVVLRECCKAKGMSNRLCVTLVLYQKRMQLFG